jgi:hypothetical protein
MSNLQINVRSLDREPIRIGAKTLSTLTSTAVDLSDGPSRRDLHRYLGRWAQVNDANSKNALAAGVDTAGGLLAWANPEGQTILITEVYLNVTTIASAACTVSVGVAANGTTLNAGLITGQDVRTAVGCFTGAGKAQQCTSSQFVTVSTASGASAGLVGNLYIGYILA